MPEVDFVAIGRWLASPEFLRNALILIGVVLVIRLLGRALGSEGDGLRRGIAATVGKAFSTNWQLTLLATTAFVLSLASGWTTWDGMRNFTGEPVLSLMITFGIQGVMLIIAWLIGESFAAGMIAGRKGGEGGVSYNIAGMLAGLMFFAGLAIIALLRFDMIETTKPWLGLASTNRLTTVMLIGAVTVMLIAPLLIKNRSAIVDDYVSGVRVIVRNAVLWVMFLACMTTSVFFSFDSLFSSIFPQDERKRAAEIRAINQVAGIVADIGTTAVSRRIAEAEALFHSESWVGYERELDKAARLAALAPEKIREEMVRELRDQESRIAKLEEQRASAQGGQAGLVQRKTQLTEELTRLTSERPEAAAAVQEQKAVVSGVEKKLDELKAKTMAEEKGVEGSGKIGRGQFWRAARGEEEKAQAELQVARERMRGHDGRLTGIDRRISAVKAELAQIDGDLAKLKGEAETTTQMIAVAKTGRRGGGEQAADPMATVASLERERQAFRQKPEQATLAALQSHCSAVQSVSMKVASLRNDAAAIDCDPKSAAEAAQRVFALNTGIVAFERNCVGGDKLPQTGGTDALLSFGRKCLQDSGLPSKESAEMGSRLAAIDLARDDKAHRFVVTWNAFSDGNRLAYLALAIAIAIDSLVFMSGLFGANAIRSPLTDLDGRGEMTAEQLEAAIDATLRTTADPAATLGALIRSLHPLDGGGGFTAEAVIHERELLADDMRSVLVAGSTIGAVRPVLGDRNRFLVKSGLARYLAVAQKKTWPTRRDEVDRKELVNVIGVSLLPRPQHAAEIVLGELHPISDVEGHAAEVNVLKIADEGHRRLVRSVIGACSTVPGGALRCNNENGRYFLSRHAYRTLLLIRAGAIPAFRDDAAGLLPSPPAQAEWGGRLTDAGAGQLPGRGPDEPPRLAPPVPPVAAPPVRAALGPPPLPRGVRPDATSLGDRLRDELIQLAGLPSWSREEIGFARGLGDSAAAEQALAQLKAWPAGIAGRLDVMLQEDAEQLDSAYRELVRHYEHDATSLEVMETIASELDRLMPRLAFSRGGRFEQILDEFIRDHEQQDGAGQLSPREQGFLARLRHQSWAFKALSPALDARIDRAAEMIRAAQDGSSIQIARDDPDKRTLN